MAKRKLNDQEVKKIRLLYDQGKMYREMANTLSIKNIAKQFNVSPTTVHGIIYNYHYNDIQ